MTIIDNTLILDGFSLTMEQIITFIENDNIKILIASRARERVAATRKQVEQLAKRQGKIIYGLHTGLGRLKDYCIHQSEQEQFQRNILYSHASGVGSCFDNTTVRLIMLLRANVLCRGNSGVRLGLIQRLVDFLNAGIYPQLPQIGSLGVGDLQPMAHLGLCLAGMPEGLAKFRDITGNMPQILVEANISPTEFRFAEREALALMSGSTAVLAASIQAWYKARHLLNLSDAALALSLEAFRGEIDAFDHRIHEARNIEAQIETASRVRQLLSGSGLVSEHARTHFEDGVSRVQDPVSFRASPQVHGAVRDALGYIESVLTREINASTDNPLFFENVKGQLESLSGGNFHGALLSYSMDLLGIVSTDLGVLSERRSARLLDPAMSYGLPYNLIIDAAGLNTGFALIHANATALIGEMRILATPASVGSIPTKNNQEDHNSMGMGAVRKTLQILEHLEMILAIEFLCAAQGIDIIFKQAPSTCLGSGTAQFYRRIREEIPPMLTDCYASKLVYNMLNLVRNETLTSLLDSILNISETKLSLIGGLLKNT